MGLLGNLVSGTWGFVKRHPLALGLTTAVGVGAWAGVKHLIAEAENLQTELMVHVQAEEARKKRLELLFEGLPAQSAVLLANFLAPLQERLFKNAACDVDSLKKLIKATPKSDRETRDKLWTKLMIVGLTRLMASIYCLSLIATLLRVQLVVLAKAQSLEVATNSNMTALKTCFTASCCSHTLMEGLDDLVGEVRTAVEAETSSWNIRETLVGPSDIMAIMRRVRQRLEVDASSLLQRHKPSTSFVAKSGAGSGAGSGSGSSESKSDEVEEEEDVESERGSNHVPLDIAATVFSKCPLLHCVVPPRTTLSAEAVAETGNELLPGDRRLVMKMIDVTFDVLESPNYQLVLRDALDKCFKKASTAMLRKAFPGYHHALTMAANSSPISMGKEPEPAAGLGNPRLLLSQVIPKASNLAAVALRYPKDATGACDPAKPWLRPPYLPSDHGNAFAAELLGAPLLHELCTVVFHGAAMSAATFQ